MEAAGFEDIHVDDMWVPLCQWYPNAGTFFSCTLTRLTNYASRQLVETPEQERINQIGIRTKRNLFVSMPLAL